MDFCCYKYVIDPKIDKVKKMKLIFQCEILDRWMYKPMDGWMDGLKDG